MEENKKVFIVGRKGCGSEIADILTGLGAKAAEVNCVGNNRIYFITHDNQISVAFIGSELARIIMDNYKEIELPQRQEWKDGDILVDDSEQKSYAVFKEYEKELVFRAYFFLYDKVKMAYFDTTASVTHYHLASAEEIENLPRLFRVLVGYLNAEGLCLPKKLYIFLYRMTI